MMRWHHVSGLLFALVTITWIQRLDVHESMEGV
jgi:hypothetical protein